MANYIANVVPPLGDQLRVSMGPTSTSSTSYSQIGMNSVPLAAQYNNMQPVEPLRTIGTGQQQQSYVDQQHPERGTKLASVTARQCMVCNDKATGPRYGALTCRSCAIFFHRIVHGGIKHDCMSTRECAIDRETRKLCQYCRFQKCLRVGMKRDLVRADRSVGRRSKKKCKEESTSYDNSQQFGSEPELNRSKYNQSNPYAMMGGYSQQQQKEFISSQVPCSSSVPLKADGTAGSIGARTAKSRGRKGKLNRANSFMVQFDDSNAGPSKNRNIQISGSNTCVQDNSKLPKVAKRCMVCDDVASRGYYGVYACNGCASFFRGSVRTEINYDCTANRACLINAQSRNHCKYCRYQKCLKVGMKRDSVKSGENPKKRKKNNEEVPKETDQTIDEITAIMDGYTNAFPDGTLVVNQDEALARIKRFVDQVPQYSEINDEDKMKLIRRSLSNVMTIRAAFTEDKCLSVIGDRSEDIENLLHIAHHVDPYMMALMMAICITCTKCPDITGVCALREAKLKISKCIEKLLQIRNVADEGAFSDIILEIFNII